MHHIATHNIGLGYFMVIICDFEGANYFFCEIAMQFNILIRKFTNLKKIKKTSCNTDELTIKNCLRPKLGHPQ